MGKKRQQMNEFYFFMCEKKPEMEKKLGRSVKMSEMSNLVYMEWKNLPEERKQKYKAMKDQARDTTEKLDCRGVPLSELRRQEEESRRRIEDMKREIGNALDFYKSGGALQHMNLHVVSVSYYVHTDEDDFTPAELAVVRFSFDKGIMKEHHVIFKPVIPLCYGFIAQEHSQATHNLLDEHNAGVDDLDEVVHDLNQFVGQESDKVPPLYTLAEDKNHTQRILDNIAGEDHFKVYSLDYFFQSFYSAALPNHPIPLSISTDMLTHCGLDFHPAMACEWHMNYQPDSGKYCSLSCTRRWVYNMCDNLNLSSTFGIEPQAGKHLPRAMPAYGVLVDVFKPIFKDAKDRVESKSSKKKGAKSSFSFSPSRTEEQSASATALHGRSTDWRNPISSSQLEGLDRRTENPWSRDIDSTPGTSRGTSSAFSSRGPSRATSMASVVSTNTEKLSEEEFPALGAGVAKRSRENQPSYASLGGVGRGLLRSPLSSNRDTPSGRGHGSISSLPPKSS